MIYLVWYNQRVNQISGRKNRYIKAMKIKKHKPTTFLIIILGFLAVIFAGALLLMLPWATKTRSVPSFETALFTSVSAVCVTGLVVKDTATYWSLFGQIIILILIQIGGLGIISIVAGLTIQSGHRFSLMQRKTMQDALSAPQVGGVVKLMRFIIRTTSIIEAAGALILMTVYIPLFGVKGIWTSVFCSVSAFCNAGFDLSGAYSGHYSSLTSFYNDPILIITVSALIITGGIGFMTWTDIAKNGIHLKRYRMQSKVILVTTLALIIIPTVIFYFEDFRSGSAADRFLLSFFQAVTPRTAGFNSADLTSMTQSGRLIIIVLMLIGGSPGSTAGGMKTTTVAMLFSNSRSIFQQRKSASAFGRRIEDYVIRSASAIATLYISLCLVNAVIIHLIDRVSLQKAIFETASAVGTVGLTLGITPELSTISHIILMILMFIGRVGGLTIIYAATSSHLYDQNQLPVEKITVG